MPRFAANLSLLFTKYDFKKHFLYASAAGECGLARLPDNLKLQYDLYHAQRMGEHFTS